MPTNADERRQLRESVRDLLIARSSEDEVRRLMDTEDGFTRGVWWELATQGLLGLAVPEKYGGAGYGMIELGIVLEEAGRALLCAPLVSSVLLAQTALLASDDTAACADLLPDLVSGQTRATLAYLEPGGHLGEAAIRVAAEPVGDAWRIDGVKVCVLDGHTADTLLVVARTPAGISLFAVDATSDGVAAHAVPTMDPTRKQARVEFHDAPARLIGTDGRGWHVLDHVLDVASCGLAAEHVGGAQRVMEIAVAYAKIREQFGRPIGSFQAVKHLCADMLVRVEASRAAAEYALQTVDDAPDELPVVASVVAGYCSESYVEVAGKNIQIHGGIGYTWEHPAHLYFKRAKTSQSLFGDPAEHRERLAQRSGIADGEWS